MSDIGEISNSPLNNLLSKANQSHGVLALSNIPMWILDYKAYGTSSYVYGNPDIWEQVMTSSEAIHDSDLMESAITFCNDNNILYELLKKYNNPKYNVDYDAETISDIFKISDYYNILTDQKIGKILTGLSGYDSALNKYLNGLSLLTRDVSFSSSGGTYTIFSSGLHYIKSITMGYSGSDSGAWFHIELIRENGTIVGKRVGCNNNSGGYQHSGTRTADIEDFADGVMTMKLVVSSGNMHPTKIVINYYDA